MDQKCAFLLIFAAWSLKPRLWKDSPEKSNGTRRDLEKLEKLISRHLTHCKGDKERVTRVNKGKQSIESRKPGKEHVRNQGTMVK